MPPRVPSAPASSLLGLVTGPLHARRWWLRALVKITGGGLGLLLVMAAIVAYLITLRPDVPAARRLAQRELQVLLEPGENVRAAAWSRRREWWDGFRETYGVLAITDTRLLFVGIPPRELVTPERGPQQFVILQLARDAALQAQRDRVGLTSEPGIAVRNARGALQFASNDGPGTESLLAEIARGLRTEAATEELGRRTREYEQDVAQQAVWHIVAPGDALASVAARYGTTEAEITALNRLPSTTIKIGQRLLVKPAVGPVSPGQGR